MNKDFKFIKELLKKNYLLNLKLNNYIVLYTIYK